MMTSISKFGSHSFKSFDVCIHEIYLLYRTSYVYALHDHIKLYKYFHWTLHFVFRSNWRYRRFALGKQTGPGFDQGKSRSWKILSSEHEGEMRGMKHKKRERVKEVVEGSRAPLKCMANLPEQIKYLLICFFTLQSLI